MNKVDKFIKIMEENGDGGWPEETAREYIGNRSLEEAVAMRLEELSEYNRGIQAAVDAGYDVEYLLRKPNH